MCAVKPVCKLDLFCGQLAQSWIEMNCKRSLAASLQSCHMVMKLSGTGNDGTCQMMTAAQRNI